MKGKKSYGGFDYPAYSELDLYIDNDYETYQRRQWLKENYKKKWNKGKFDFKKAQIGVERNVVSQGARKYTREFGGNSRTMFLPKVRKAVAKAQLRKIMEDIRGGY